MNKIIVSNFPTNFTTDDIQKLFSLYGTIKDISKTQKAIFITYTSKQSCIEAINKMNGKLIKQETIKVDWAYERDAKVYVHNLPIDILLEEISSFFSYYGEIQHIKFLKHILFIVFVNKRDAANLILLNGKIKFKNNYLKISNTINISSDKYCVYCYNVSDEITELDLLQIFSKYGEIISSGINNGKGYINFEKESAAYKAVKYMDGKKIKDKKLRVVLKPEKNKI